MKTLNSKTALELFRIFTDNGWNDKALIDSDDQKSSFNRMCRALELMNDDEKGLILDLLRYFKVFDLVHYETLLVKCFKKAFSENQLLANCTTIHILKLPNSSDKIKSQDLIYYLIDNGKLQFESSIPYNKFKFANSVENIPSAINNYIKHAIIVVDDFIGTGESIKKAVEVISRSGISKSKVIVLGLVALEAGIDYLKSQGIDVICDVILEKGISDRYTGNEKVHKLQTMLKIEEKFAITKKFSLGYGQSEALVKMIRTPDNTFPIFWRVTGVNKQPVFERRIGDEQIE